MWEFCIPFFTILVTFTVESFIFFAVFGLSSSPSISLFNSYQLNKTHSNNSQRFRHFEANNFIFFTLLQSLNARPYRQKTMHSQLLFPFTFTRQSQKPRSLFQSINSIWNPTPFRFWLEPLNHQTPWSLSPRYLKLTTPFAKKHIKFQFLPLPTFSFLSSFISHIYCINGFCFLVCDNLVFSYLLVQRICLNWVRPPLSFLLYCTVSVCEIDCETASLFFFLRMTRRVENSNVLLFFSR